MMEHVPRDSHVLDIGAYASEVLYILNTLGYTDLTGVDLNPRLSQMPHADTIKYREANFLHSPFPDESFHAVTAISVIEHGFHEKQLLAEMARLLKPGGYFLASVDYWPEKVDTIGMEVFGLDWIIFSEDELRSLMENAPEFGLRPFGKMSFGASERTIRWGGKRYTFAWLVLKKT
jgi:SAM-dependent methyltransferase